MKQQIGVVVCDTHQLSRNGLVRLLTEEEDIEVASECARGEDAITVGARASSRRASHRHGGPRHRRSRGGEELGKGDGLPQVILIGGPCGRPDSGSCAGERCVRLPYARLCAGGGRDGGAKGGGGAALRRCRGGTGHGHRQVEPRKLSYRHPYRPRADGDGHGQQRIRSADHIRSACGLSPKTVSTYRTRIMRKLGHVERCRAYPSILSARAASSCSKQTRRCSPCNGSTGSEFAPVGRTVQYEGYRTRPPP